MGRKRHPRRAWIAAFLLAATSAVPGRAADETVDPRTGRLAYAVTDLDVPAGAVSVRVERVLVAPGGRGGIFGRTFRTEWEDRLEALGDSLALEGVSGTEVLRPGAAAREYAGAGGTTATVADDGSTRVRRAGGGVLTFDAGGRLRARADARGNVVELAYDQGGVLARIAGPEAALRLVADAEGRVARIEAPGGRTATYEYRDGVLVAAGVDGAAPERYGYDERGRLARIERPRTGAVDLARDAAGRVVSRRWETGEQETWERDDRGGTVRHTDPAGGTTLWKRSADGRREERTDPDGSRTLTRLDERLLPAEVTLPGGSVLKLAHDELGRQTALEGCCGPVRFEYLRDTRLPTATVFPDGTRVETRYDEAGSVVEIRTDGRTTAAFSYHPGGLLRSLSGEGRAASFDYTSDGRLDRVTDALGGETRFSWDQAGNLVRRTSPGGAVTKWTHDRAGRVLTETDPGGGVTTFAWDARGRLASRTDAEGGSTTYAYDARGRVVAETDPLGRETRIAYHPLGLPAKVTTPEGATRFIAYDAAGRTTSIVDARGARTSFAYDAAGRLTERRDAAGGVWTYRYSADGAEQTVTDPEGGTTVFRDDPKGRRREMTDPTGVAATVTLDSRGRALGLRRPDGRDASYEYDEFGRIARLAFGGGGVTIAYDAMGRVTRVARASGLNLQYTYDADGRLTAVGEAGARVASTRYSPRGEPVEVRDAAGARWRYRYDRAGRLTEEEDPRGEVLARSYNAAGDLVEVTGPTGNRLRFSYDGAGRLTGIEVPGGGTRRLAFDDAGALVELADPGAAPARFAYGPTGLLDRRTEPDGSEIRYRYDRAGRLAAKELPGGRAVRYRRDAAGRLLEADDGALPERRGYDRAGRLVRVELPGPGVTLAYEYDAAGRLARFSGPEGASYACAYDRFGRLETLTPDGGRPFRFAWDARDRLVELAYPNGTRQLRAYDAAGRLARLEHRAPDGRPLRSWELAYDEAGNLVRAVDADGKETRYAYDAAGRLVEERAPGGKAAWRYDRAGNREEETRAGAKRRYRHDAADRILEAGAATFRHDAAGRLVEKRDGGGVTTYAWDAEGRLVRAALPDGTAVAFGYGAGGGLSWREGGGERTWFVEDGVNLVAELDAARRVRTAIIHGPGIDQPLLVRRDGATRFFHADRLGSAAALTDDAGAVAASWRFGAFGEIAAADGDGDGSPLLFTARWTDPDLGLVYVRARWYDPALGRFLSPDPLLRTPLDPDAVNRYAYARNAPTRYTDPLGLAEQEGEKGFEVTPGFLAESAAGGAATHETPGLWERFRSPEEFDDINQPGAPFVPDVTVTRTPSGGTQTRLRGPTAQEHAASVRVDRHPEMYAPDNPLPDMRNAPRNPLGEVADLPGTYYPPTQAGRPVANFPGRYHPLPPPTTVRLKDGVLKWLEERQQRPGVAFTSREAMELQALDIAQTMQSLIDCKTSGMSPEACAKRYIVDYATAKLVQEAAIRLGAAGYFTVAGLVVADIKAIISMAELYQELKKREEDEKTRERNARIDEMNRLEFERALKDFIGMQELQMTTQGAYALEPLAEAVRGTCAALAAARDQALALQRAALAGALPDRTGLATAIREACGAVTPDARLAELETKVASLAATLEEGVAGSILLATTCSTQAEADRLGELYNSCKGVAQGIRQYEAEAAQIVADANGARARAAEQAKRTALSGAGSTAAVDAQIAAYEAQRPKFIAVIDAAKGARDALRKMTLGWKPRLQHLEDRVRDNPSQSHMLGTPVEDYIANREAMGDRTIRATFDEYRRRVDALKARREAYDAVTCDWEGYAMEISAVLHVLQKRRTEIADAAKALEGVPATCEPPIAVPAAIAGAGAKATETLGDPGRFAAAQQQCREKAQEKDADEDGTPDEDDECPNDANKVEPLYCGCNKPETPDRDEDGVPACVDKCDDDPKKTDPGVCGCNVPEDANGDGVPDCKQGAQAAGGGSSLEPLPWDEDYEDFVRGQGQREGQRGTRVQQQAQTDADLAGQRPGTGFDAAGLDRDLAETAQNVAAQTDRNRQEEGTAGGGAPGGQAGGAPGTTPATTPGTAPAAPPECGPQKPCPKKDQACVDGKCVPKPPPTKECGPKRPCPSPDEECVKGQCRKKRKPGPTRIKCNDLAGAGEDAPQRYAVDVGDVKGAATLTFEFYGVPDQIIVNYAGRQVVNTGCRGGAGSASFATDGTHTRATVMVNAACREPGTRWNFTLTCPKEKIVK